MQDDELRVRGTSDSGPRRSVPQIGSEKAVWSSFRRDWVLPAKNKGQDKNKTAAAATFVKWMNDHSLGVAETGAGARRE